MTSLPPNTTEINPLDPPPPRVIGVIPPKRSSGAPRPKGVHTKHLTELERFRVRTLYYDALLNKNRIKKITGYSDSQIRTAIRAKTSSITRRPGRPKKGSKGEPESCYFETNPDRPSCGSLPFRSSNFIL